MLLTPPPSLMPLSLAQNHISELPQTVKDLPQQVRSGDTSSFTDRR